MPFLMQTTARRIVLEVLGWVLVLAGFAALVLPGPGLLILFAGLTLLSQRYEWAQRRVEPAKARALKAAAGGVATWPRIIGSSLMALLMIAAGIYWIWSPPVPGWWPLRDSWWLAGGIATGSTVIFSGLIALATIAYSFRRFRGRDEESPKPEGS